MTLIQIVLFTFFSLVFGGLLNIDKSEINKNQDLKGIINLYPEKGISDVKNLKLHEVKDVNDHIVFYYANITMHPCEGDVCNIMSLRMYWDYYGNYHKIEVLKKEPLTKVEHKVFSEKDYRILHNSLLDTASRFSDFKLEEMTTTKAEASLDDPDAISGATINTLTFDYVKGAVKTNFQLWHIANGDIRQKIKNKKINGNIGIAGSINDKKGANSELNALLFINDMEHGDMQSKSIKKAAKLSLNKNSNFSLIVYNFMIRNNIKKGKRFAKKYSRKFLINDLLVEKTKN